MNKTTRPLICYPARKYSTRVMILIRCDWWLVGTRFVLSCSILRNSTAEHSSQRFDGQLSTVCASTCHSRRLRKTLNVLLYHESIMDVIYSHQHCYQCQGRILYVVLVSGSHSTAPAMCVARVATCCANVRKPCNLYYVIMAKQAIRLMSWSKHATGTSRGGISRRDVSCWAVRITAHAHRTPAS